MNPKKICIVTGTRAEYGLLKPLIHAVGVHPGCKLQLVVTGAHLCSKFGYTIQEIYDDGFEVAAKVDILLSNDTPKAITKSMGLAAIGFAETFDDLKPEIVVLLGDRYELLPVAQAALMARIPIAHIHGGEATWGALDDSIRHALTKLSSLHFTSTIPYRNRILAMGENPAHVHHVGALVHESLKKLPFLSQKELEDNLNFDLARPFFLVTYHPPTLDSLEALEQDYVEFLKGLKEFSDFGMIFTGVNADPGGSVIARLTHEFKSQQKQPEMKIFENLGQLKYLSLMKLCAAVVGNSSSGILEAHLLGVPAVNVGPRQKGRIQARSVVNCEARANEVVRAVQTAVSPMHRAETLGTPSPYEASLRQSEFILNTLLESSPKELLQKTFFDLNSL